MKKILILFLSIVMMVSLFGCVDNPNGNGGKRLKVNCANGAWVRGSDGRPVPAKSISVWYKDELSYKNNTEGLITTGEKGYHFVFGINTGFVTAPSDIYINLSLLSKTPTQPIFFSTISVKADLVEELI